MKLFLGEAARVGWQVGEDEGSGESNCHGDGTLDCSGLLATIRGLHGRVEEKEDEGCSLQKSQRQAAWPRTPCMLESTPAPTRAENAFEMRFPQKRMAFLSVSSRLVYHLERMSSAPGRNAASTKPRKKRMVTMPAKSFAMPLSVEIRPQMTMTTDMYSDGRWMRLMKMLDGTCIKM